MKEDLHNIYKAYLIYKWLRLQGKLTALEIHMDRQGIDANELYEQYSNNFEKTEDASSTHDETP